MQAWFCIFSVAFLAVIYSLSRYYEVYQEDELTKMYAESRIPPSMFKPRVNWYIENLTIYIYIYIAFYALLRVIITCPSV